MKPFTYRIQIALFYLFFFVHKYNAQNVSAGFKKKKKQKCVIYSNFTRKINENCMDEACVN